MDIKKKPSNSCDIRWKYLGTLRRTRTKIFSTLTSSTRYAQNLHNEFDSCGSLASSLSLEPHHETTTNRNHMQHYMDALMRGCRRGPMAATQRGHPFECLGGDSRVSTIQSSGSPRLPTVLFAECPKNHIFVISCGACT